MNAEPAPATFTTYEEMVAVFRARRIELGLSQLAVDQAAGLPDGYQSKIEMSLSNPTARNSRSIGRESLPLILGALGLTMAALPQHRSPATTPQDASNSNGKRSHRIKTLAERGQKGGRIRWARMSDKQRAAMIRKMNRARAAKLAAKRTKRAKEKAA
jgi:transcriptional regulator with XRE-family HTH domain